MKFHIMLFIVAVMLMSANNTYSMPTAAIRRTRAVQNYRLKHSSVENGAITITCYDFDTDEPVDKPIKFRVNGTSLTERSDVQVIENTTSSIKFIFTHSLEGNYTCGRQLVTDDQNKMPESEPVILTAFQILYPNNFMVPLPKNVQTTFRTMAGDNAVIHCPLQPGVYLKYYTVTWMKDENTIATLSGTKDPTGLADPRYDIDRSDFSLIINRVKGSDSSDNYQCSLFVNNPITDANRRIYTSNVVSLKLHVTCTASTANRPIISPTAIVLRSAKDEPSFMCTVHYTASAQYPAPDITWSYSINQGEEIELYEGDNCQLVSTSFQKGETGSLFTRHSAITLQQLNMATNDSAIVKCKVGQAVSEAHLFMIGPATCKVSNGTLASTGAVLDNTACTCY